MSMHRFSSTIISCVIGTTVAQSSLIHFGEFESGMIFVPAGSSLTTLTWYSSHTSENSDMLPAYDSAGAIVQTVAAGRSYPIPESLKGTRYLKATGNASGAISCTLKN